MFRPHPDRVHIFFPVWLLKDLSDLDRPRSIVKFWESIAVYDERSIARRLAVSCVEQIAGKHAARAIRLRREWIEAASRRYEDWCTDVTIEFRNRIKHLFGSLKQDGILGVDDYNGGWSPHDHWIETALDHFFLRDPNEQLYFLDCWPDSAMRICYVDTLWEFKQNIAKVGFHRTLSSPCESALCYYVGADKTDKEFVASRIVDLAPAHGLLATWNGDPDSSLLIEHNRQ